MGISGNPGYLGFSRLVWASLGYECAQSMFIFLRVWRHLTHSSEGSRRKTHQSGCVLRWKTAQSQQLTWETHALYQSGGTAGKGMLCSSAATYLGNTCSAAMLKEKVFVLQWF